MKKAEHLLLYLARRLEDEYPSAAESVREGVEETLTVQGLGLSERLQRSLTMTNATESLISRTRHVKRNVKRWRGGEQPVLAAEGDDAHLVLGATMHLLEPPPFQPADGTISQGSVAVRESARLV